MILLEKVSEKDATSFWVPFSVYADSKHYSFRIGCTKLTKEICGIMGWATDKSYRIPGWLFPEGGFARFDLVKATDITIQAHGNIDSSGEEKHKNRAN